MSKWPKLPMLWDDLIKNNTFDLTKIASPQVITHKSNLSALLTQNQKVFFISMEDGPEIDNERLLKMQSHLEKEKIMNKLDIESDPVIKNNTKKRL